MDFFEFSEIQFSKFSYEVLSKGLDLLDEYIDVLSYWFRNGREDKNFDKETLQNKITEYINNIDENEEPEKKMMAQVVLNVDTIDRFIDDSFLEKINSYASELISYRFKLEDYLYYSEKEDDSYNKAIENIEPYYSKYGRDIVDSAEKKINDYPDYLVLGSIFTEEELPYISEKFSEGNSEYADVLYNLNKNGLYTLAGCIGHDEFDRPYILFRVPENNLKFFDKFMTQFFNNFKGCGYSGINFDHSSNTDFINCAIYSLSIEERALFYESINSAIEFAKDDRVEESNGEYEKSCILMRKILEKSNNVILGGITFNTYSNPELTLSLRPGFQSEELFEPKNRNALNIYSNLSLVDSYGNLNEIDYYDEEIDKILQNSNNTTPSFSQYVHQYYELYEEEDNILSRFKNATKYIDGQDDDKLQQINSSQQEIINRISVLYPGRENEIESSVERYKKSNQIKE